MNEMVVDLTRDVGPLCGYMFCPRRKRRRAERNGQERTHERTDRRADGRTDGGANGPMCERTTTYEGNAHEWTDFRTREQNDLTDTLPVRSKHNARRRKRLKRPILRRSDRRRERSSKVQAAARTDRRNKTRRTRP